MNAQDAVNKLASHLLGKNWYIVDPVNAEQANAIIYDEITSKYKAIDESPENRYRRGHKRCKWCKHAIRKFNGHDYSYICAVKDKRVNPHNPKPFCSVYSLLPFKHSTDSDN